MINIDIKVGDTILTGKFRNKKTIVKSIGTDEYGSPTVNGKSILKIRVPKLMKKESTTKLGKIVEEIEKVLYQFNFKDGTKAHAFLTYSERSSIPKGNVESIRGMKGLEHTVLNTPILSYEELKAKCKKSR